MILQINGLRLYLRVCVYVAILASVLHNTECLESRRSDDKRLLAVQCSNDVDIYDHERCKLESNEENSIPSLQWEDPFDMLPSQTHNVKNAKPRLKESEKRELQCAVYMQRFINLFLRMSGLVNYSLQSGSKKQIKFDFIINKEDLAVLQKFGESGRNEDIFAVNDALSRIFGPTEGTVYSEKPSAFEHNINIPFSQGIYSFPSKVYSSVVESPEVTIPICIITVSIAAFCLVYTTRSYKLAAVAVLYVVFAANFGITWYRMYQEEISMRFYEEMKYSGAPPHCKGEPLPWFERLYASLFGEDCEEYYKKHFTSPMSRISLNAVFSESMSVLLLYPAQHVAKAYGDFITTATSSVHFLLKPIVFPIVCIVPILFIFTLLAFLLDYQISISPFTGLRVIPSWGQSRCCKEQEKTKPIEKPVDTGGNSKSKKISSPLESAVASNDSSPLILMNWPAVQKFMHTSQKVQDNAAEIDHNNKVCKNCQIVMTVPSDGSGGSSKNIPSSGLKKKSGGQNQEDSSSKQVKESEQNVKHYVTCSGDCCENDKACNVISEDVNSVSKITEEEGKESVQQVKATENKEMLISSCQCQQNNNEALTKDSLTVSEKLKEPF